MKATESEIRKLKWPRPVRIRGVTTWDQRRHQVTCQLYPPSAPVRSCLPSHQAATSEDTGAAHGN
jgi:hypothetical protein